MVSVDHRLADQACQRWLGDQHVAPQRTKQRQLPGGKYNGTTQASAQGHSSWCMPCKLATLTPGVMEWTFIRYRRLCARRMG